MVSSAPTNRDIFRARFFEEPLVPVGADSTPDENAALVDVLIEYSQRSGPDDFSSLTRFIDAYPTSPWNAALLTNLGLEYYNTGHYSKTLEVWNQAWELAKDITELKGKAIADRAIGELAYMYARLGRMTELRTLLMSVEGRAFSGAATERITGAREGLWTMENRPEVAFLCGPLALRRIKVCLDPTNPGTELIQAYVSTHRGCSLRQIAELSQELGLDFQMVCREADTAFVVPAVIHLKVDHFAAITRQEGDRYLLQDTTFGNDAWVSREALDAEASGYFLIPPGELAHGWRAVEALEGETVWGKGQTSTNDPDPHGPCDPASPGGNTCPKDSDDCRGMAVPRVHLMLVSLNINDEPVGYSPPIGPAVRFMVRYNQRESRQPAIFSYSNLGPKWTFDWLSYITDSPLSPSADVSYYIMGGGTRTFTGFDGGSKTFAFQQLDQTKLTYTPAGNITPVDTYEMVSRDGSKKIFGNPDGSKGNSRKIFLTQIIDPHGNAVTLNYDADLRMTTITDAIGQVTTISYDPTDTFKITKVIDPFGRFATFDYDDQGRLIKITDVTGITSEFTYDAGDFITTLTTPYGVTTFDKDTVSHNVTTRAPGNTRSLETVYPNGERDRIEYNQFVFFGGGSVRVQDLPEGMVTAAKDFHEVRNTFYWSKKAYAATYPDYQKAKIYHWLHGRAYMADFSTTAGILESIKEPLEGSIWEGRVWFDYAGQGGNSIAVGSTNKPAHVGRVLDDSSTQLYTYEYNGFGNVTNTIDPVGRTFTYTYHDNGIDLLKTEQTQTRAGQSELLSNVTYNAQHLPLTSTDAAGQTTTYAYNARGQVLTKTNAKNETIAYNYDINGNLISIDGPLPGSSITFTYDSVSRLKTKTGESGYELTFDYDALDRLTKIVFPDGTFDEYTYTLLDLTMIRDRAGRQTTFEYDSIRQMTKRTDPLNRATLFQWCKCGALRSLTDPLGRTTSWEHDIQGRLESKKYADGSKVTYLYEDTTSRLRQRIDEKLQVTQYNYNRDDTISQISYTNAAVATPHVAFTYDAHYNRLRSMTDGTGTTHYDYIPINAAPSLGAGLLSSVNGPLPNDTIIFSYDELGRRISTAINGVASTVTLDAAGRMTNTTNILGTFNYTYDGKSHRIASQSYPNGQITEFGYAGNLKDQHLKKITDKLGITPVSEFIYDHDVPTGQITSWSQQLGSQTPSVFSLDYDSMDQLISASVAEGGVIVKTFGYSYDPASNRLTEQVDATTRVFSYNALNELTSVEGHDSPSASYKWDAEHRLVAVASGNHVTEITYDGIGRRVGIRQLLDGAEVSNRLFVWCDNKICEERASTGIVSKRFFDQGVKIETGSTTGEYFYLRDHLGSIRELIDSGGSVRAQYSYDPYGHRTLLFGDLDGDFGFAGMLWIPKIQLNLTTFRAYDPNIGRWLSRDPLKDSELNQGYNLFCYVNNNPANYLDLTGLRRCRSEYDALMLAINTADVACILAGIVATTSCVAAAGKLPPYMSILACSGSWTVAAASCILAALPIVKAKNDYEECMQKPWIDYDSQCDPIPNTFPNV